MGWTASQYAVNKTGPTRQDAMTKQTKQTTQTKQESREEIDRLVKEALERRSVTVTKVDARREEKCGKCGAPNRVKIPIGQTRVEYKCKECGHQQRTM